MKESNQPGSGLQDQDQLRKGLEDEEERKRRERLQKALSDEAKKPKTGLSDPTSWSDT